MKDLRGRFVCAAAFMALSAVLFSLQPAAAGMAQREPLPVELKAKSAILMDENGVVLFEKDSHCPLPPASVTKVMTLLLAVEAVESGKAGLDDPIVASENAWRQGGSQIWLEAGEMMTYHELLTAVAVVSANDAAVALMEHLYGSEAAAVAAMNDKARELGLTDTHFSNVNGLPVSDHYLSAYDTAMLVKEALRHKLYMDLCGVKEYWLRGGKNWLVNTNKLLWWYDGADGLKTGWTNEAQYCFAGTAKRGGLRLISVVFAAPEPRSHLKESMKLLDWGFAHFKALPIVKEHEVVAKLQVSKGTIAEIDLLAAHDLQVLSDKNTDKQEIEQQILTMGPAAAPVEKGEVCGTLLVLKGGRECGRVDLIAGQSVRKADFFQALHAMFLHLLSR